ncbi:hypothetical protein L1887_30464 [Cichorium endivia]|nr:hypothetical protein L1887_30464 [Cichorium endivia]
MKVSPKLKYQQQNQSPILVRAKIPISVFGLPFFSAFSTTHHHVAASDKISLSRRTHFLSGPSLKLSYNTPTTTTATSAAAATAPLTFTLKSGVSLLGSPTIPSHNLRQFLFLTSTP